MSIPNSIIITYNKFYIKFIYRNKPLTNFIKIEKTMKFKRMRMSANGDTEMIISIPEVTSKHAGKYTCYHDNGSTMAATIIVRP